MIDTCAKTMEDDLQVRYTDDCFDSSNDSAEDRTASKMNKNVIGSFSECAA